MNELNRYIPELINGTLHQLSEDMEYEWSMGDINPGDYHHYIPELCSYIESEQNESNREEAYLALDMILLPDMDPDFIHFLLNRLLLEYEDENKEIIMGMLERININETFDLEPLKQEVRKNHFVNGPAALRVFGNIPHGENFLLEVLRRTQDDFYIYEISQILQDIGSFHCLPVLMAKLDSSIHADELDKKIYSTVDAIGTRLNLPRTTIIELKDPNFWKLGWAGSLQEFVNYMNQMALFVAGDKITEEERDALGDIYIDAMGVNISPYNSFRELRICSNDDPAMLKSHVKKVMDGLQSILLMDSITNGTGIVESKESRIEHVMNDLRIDYLTTRLRRNMGFQDDDY